VNNIALVSYPALCAPIPVFEKRAGAWLTSEADAFFHWLVANYESRVGILLKFLKKVLPKTPQEWMEFLQEVGLAYADQLRRKEFSLRKGETFELTVAGSSLVFDANLLVAQLLIRYPGSKVHWHLHSDPGSFSHNHPILKGFTHDRYLDPFGGFREAHALLLGKKSASLLKDIFSFWKDTIA
jgi:hypothetical protein